MPTGPTPSGVRLSTGCRSGVLTVARNPAVVWQRAQARSLRARGLASARAIAVPRHAATCP